MSKTLDDIGVSLDQRHMSKQSQRYVSFTTFMVFGIFRAILCCCQSPPPEEQNDDPQAYDETEHLIIPEIIETPVGTEEVRLSQARLRERLTEIVRSKEGRMVNVAAQAPFNLHNRVIPKEHSHSSSRSTLDSENLYHDHPYYSDFYSYREIARFRKERSKYFHGLGRLRSLSPSFHGSDIGGPSSRTRSPSPNNVVEQPSATRLLNIRLVGYTETNTRGRARERTQHPTGLPGLQKAESDSTTVEVAPETQQGSASAEGSTSSAAKLPEDFGFQFPDVEDMIMKWD